MMTVRPVPPILAEKAKNELNEDPNRLKNDLQSLKDWIAKQPHLRARTGEFYCILKFRFLLTGILLQGKCNAGWIYDKAQSHNIMCTCIKAYQISIVIKPPKYLHNKYIS